ncbi:caspase family protein [Limnohabitans sp.]|uniref:caspase family protein n=1 Tax=Limnohabitans sp. TaxID=1907725 RepID=UPI00333E8E15
MPVNDATDIDQALKRFGFQTTFLRNASLGQMREATRRFADQLTNADVALIYFAGHAIESKNRNYMIPVNADLKFEYELADQAYDAAAWLEMLEMIKSNNAERVNIVILDACRNNNLIGSRSLNRGLGRMDAPAGTFLSYSTAPGKVAADGSKGERNSPFTRNLLKAIQQPGLPIEEVFKEVRRNVTRETNGAQVPWESTSLTGFFSFRQTR